jgi:hypothetical protein
MDLKNYIVPKPWGYEYLIFENEKIGIWLLHLNKNEKTSLHCHPDKKTGLILLDGNAEVSFLNNKVPLVPFSKVMIREGVFHSTLSLSDEGIDVVEVETPKDKENLVRMEDAYGRKGKHYESINECIIRTNGELWINDVVGEKKTYKGYLFKVEWLTESLLNASHDNDIVIILSDIGIVSKDGFSISKIGDTITVHTIKRLLKDFEIKLPTYALIISQS